MSAPICFVDTECTSLRWNRRPWEIALIRRDDQGQRERRFFIKNVDLTDADPASLAVGGFYDRHPQYAPGGTYPGGAGDHLMIDRFAAAHEVERITRGAVIIGSNPAFDADVFEGMLRSVNLVPAWHYRTIDVATLAAGWLVDGPFRMPPWSSDELARDCGVKPAPDGERHTALGDARWVMRWFDLLIADDDAKVEVA